MTELPKSMLSSQAEVWGAPEPFRAGKPDTLSEYVVILAGANPDGIFTEIDFDGVERSRTYGELLQDAKSLAARIEASRPPAGRFALLCYETVVDYIPAAWACLFSDFSFLPLSPSQLSRSCGEFFRRTQQTIEALGNPLVLTEARFERPLYEIDSQAPVLNTKRLLALPLVANASKVSSRDSVT